MTGYSQTPLAKKLGIKPGFRVKTVNAPPDYAKLLDPLPGPVTLSPRLRADVDMVHLFTTRRAELESKLPSLIDEIRRDGMIWVSWPKKSSGVTTDITEDTIREVCLPLGLVDVKVCAVDSVWSGLKLVVRKELRWTLASLAK
ncbi:MAG: hypothetical protein R2832_00040 [Rhodothermales bacterium]